MKAWEIDELRRGCKGKWVMRGERTRPFNGRICTDSRTAAVGDCFVAIKGERFDAHDFVPAVIDQAVAAILIHKELPADLLTRARDQGVAIIGVEDTIAGLNRLAAAYRSNEITTGGGGFRAKVIAVGGSNGKTTTKRILHALLAEKFGNAGGGGGGGGGIASPKSFNNNIGMPLTLLDVMPAHDYVVLEIGTNAPGEIAALGAVCRPDVALITSVGMEHLEKLGDLAGVAREEAAIAEHISANGMLILPDVPELLRQLALPRVQKLIVQITNYQLPMTSDQTPNDQTARLQLTSIQERPDGTTFSINGRGSFHIPLLGAHNAMNALMAIAAARRLGVSDEQIAAGLLKATPAEGRFERLQIGDWAVINDAYNANPSSVEASLGTFARLTGDAARRRHSDAARRRRVVILGDMLELGSASEPMHRAVGKQVAEWGFELFLAIGPAMQAAADAARSGKGDVQWFTDTTAAQAGLLTHLRPGDDILLKGSHGMALERLLATLRASRS